MSNFTDAFGALVTDNGGGTWTRGGVTVHAATQARATQVLNLAVSSP